MLITFLLLWLSVARDTHISASASRDTVSSGNYLIHLCDSGKPNSNAIHLQELLPQINANLQAVIADAHLGTASKRGYGAFFKTNDSIHEVIRVYEQMAAGTDVIIRSIPGRQLPGPLAARPTFVCINDIPGTGAIHQQCVNEHSTTRLVVWEDSELIALCPLFWDQKKVPLRNDCPRLKGNTLTPNNMQLSSNQEAMIVYGLTHLYVNVTKWPNMALNIQDAVDLNETDSLANPTNYALYYAGQCSLLFRPSWCFSSAIFSSFDFVPLHSAASLKMKSLTLSRSSGVQAGCKKWPRLRSRGNRGLLDIAANVSNVITSNTPIQSAIKTVTTADVEPPANSPDALILQRRQSSCLNWAEAPNSTVCCDQNSGEWIEAPIQRDTASTDPACPTVVEGVGSDGQMVASNTQTAPAVAQTTFSNVQTNYCTGQMHLPNSTVCCDMSSGLWVPAPVIRDTMATIMVSAACPTTKSMGGLINT